MTADGKPLCPCHFGWFPLGGHKGKPLISPEVSPKGRVCVSASLLHLQPPGRAESAGPVNLCGIYGRSTSHRRPPQTQEDDTGQPGGGLLLGPLSSACSVAPTAGPKVGIQGRTVVVQALLTSSHPSSPMLLEGPSGEESTTTPTPKPCLCLPTTPAAWGSSSTCLPHRLPFPQEGQQLCTSGALHGPAAAATRN